MKHLLTLLTLTFILDATASEAIMGRLFHTPEQRARLDALRSSMPAVDPEKSPVFHFDGEVRRSHRPGTYWLNGLPHAGPAPSLTIGDSLDRRSGEIQPLLTPQQLQIMRRP